MKTILMFASALTITVASYGQDNDTTEVPVKQGDPEVRQTPEQLQQAMLKDMVQIPSSEAPEKIKAAVSGSDFRGAKTFYKHKSKDEFAVEVKKGEISSFHFFDKNGQPRNKQN